MSHEPSLRDFTGYGKRIVHRGDIPPWGRRERTLDRAINWGGTFANIHQSAWNIVNHFVHRITSRIQKKQTDGAMDTVDITDMSDEELDLQDMPDLSESDIADMVDTLAIIVASVEIVSAVEGAVLAGMTDQGVLLKYWNAQPDGCPECQDNDDASPIGLDESFPSGDSSPPAHARCRCSLSGG